MEYPVQDEVPKQNPVSDLQEQPISQPSLLLSLICFSKENLQYHTEEDVNKYRVQNIIFLANKMSSQWHKCHIYIHLIKIYII